MDSTVAARYVPLEVVPAAETPVSDILKLVLVYLKLFTSNFC